jgi:hypothetical protein
VGLKEQAVLILKIFGEDVKLTPGRAGHDQHIDNRMIIPA